MRKLLLPLLFLLALVMVAPLGKPVFAQSEPVVRAVLFYSPTCGLCEKVIKTDLPPIANKYKDQLHIVGVDVSKEGGAALFQAALKRYNVPDERVGVPMLVVNDTVLVGGDEIPQLFPAIIESTLSAGGSDWPDIPGLQEALAGAGERPSSASNGATAQTDSNQPLFISAFLRDPLANSIAVFVLLAMLAVTVVIVIVFIKAKPLRIMQGPVWLLPLLAVIGIFIAGYMTYIEVSKTQAICGPVGDCNTVQESPYATLFGFLPVGVLGLLGYLAIVVSWLVWSLGPLSLHKLSLYTIWGMGWFGVIFSIYLTFLEPFVIGASCAWCISSAIVITLLFWFSTGMMQEVWVVEEDEEDEDGEDVETFEGEEEIDLEAKEKSSEKSKIAQEPPDQMVQE